MQLPYLQWVAILHSPAFQRQKLGRVSIVDRQATSRRIEVMLAPSPKMGNNHLYNMEIVWTQGMRKLHQAERVGEQWRWDWWTLQMFDEQSDEREAWKDWVN